MPQYGAIDLLYYAYQNHLNSRRLQRFLSLLQKQDEIMIRFNVEIETLSKRCCNTQESRYKSLKVDMGVCWRLQLVLCTMYVSEL